MNNSHKFGSESKRLKICWVIQLNCFASIVKIRPKPTQPTLNSLSLPPFLSLFLFLSQFLSHTHSLSYSLKHAVPFSNPLFNSLSHTHLNIVPVSFSQVTLLQIRGGLWKRHCYKYFTGIESQRTLTKVGKYHCTADLLFDLFGFDQTSKVDANSTKAKLIKTKNTRSAVQWYFPLS